MYQWEQIELNIESLCFVCINMCIVQNYIVSMCFPHSIVVYQCGGTLLTLLKECTPTQINHCRECKECAHTLVNHYRGFLLYQWEQIELKRLCLCMYIN